MDTIGFKIYDEEDVEIHENGISLKGTFFSKQKIADTFNELILINKFIENHCANE